MAHISEQNKDPCAAYTVAGRAKSIINLENKQVVNRSDGDTCYEKMRKSSKTGRTERGRRNHAEKEDSWPHSYSFKDDNYPIRPGPSYAILELTSGQSCGRVWCR